MYVKFPTPVANTDFHTSYGLGAFFGVVFGPIAGALIAFIGHALSDTFLWGSAWWSWVIASGVAGFGFGLAKKWIDLNPAYLVGKKSSPLTWLRPQPTWSPGWLSLRYSIFSSTLSRSILSSLKVW